MYTKYGKIVENATQLDFVKKKVKNFWQNLSNEELTNWFKNHWKVYTYQNVKFDSSWELALYIYAKDHDEEIEREPCCFEYYFNKEKHRYFPDFKYKGNLIEIKNNYLLEDLNIINTKENAKLKCIKDNKVQIWTIEKIQPYVDYIENKYGKDYLQQFKN